MSTFSSYADAEAEFCHSQTSKTGLIMLISRFADCIIITDQSEHVYEKEWERFVLVHCIYMGCVSLLFV